MERQQLLSHPRQRHSTLSTESLPSNPALNPLSSTMSTSSSSGNGSANSAHLSNILSCLTGMPRGAPPPTTPKCVLDSVAVVLPIQNSSPLLVNTPTKLTHFLEYAQANLGVPNTLAYEAQMRLKGFGPDILHLFSQDSLVNLGMTPGDAICLQTNAPKWWNGSHAK